MASSNLFNAKFFKWMYGNFFVVRFLPCPCKQHVLGQIKNLNLFIFIKKLVLMTYGTLQ
jgi:hypothetical protein